jgi:hypothetical protein
VMHTVLMQKREGVGMGGGTMLVVMAAINSLFHF